MKKIILSITVLSLVACGGAEEHKEENKEKEAIVDQEREENEETEMEKKNPMAAFSEMAEGMKDMAEAMQNGEGGEPIHYTELQAFLPTELPGYTTGEPSGETVKMQGFNVSSAEVEYTNDNGDYVKISIIDYLAAGALYNAASAMWAMGLEVDSSEEMAKGFTLGGDKNGWETFQKKSKDAEAVLGVNNRLIITVDADNQENTDYVKSVLKSMDLEGLSAL